MELTEWYPGEVKPVYEGWYLRKFEHIDDTAMYYWQNGWYYDEGIEAANLSINTELPWRGLAKQPSNNGDYHE